MTLDGLVAEVAATIIARAKEGKFFGTVLIPEGVVEFIPAIKKLIAELNDLLAHHEAEVNALANNDEKRALVAKLLSADSAATFASLPVAFANQLMLDRDPHGNVQVSLIETEKLLIDMVKAYIKKNEPALGAKFQGQPHFFGYEGRCAAPSNFDADYCYSLGYTASVLIGEGKTGYMASVRNLTAPTAQWIAGGVPVTMMMNMEKRHGHMKPVIQKALVDLNGAPFKKLVECRNEWATQPSFVYPGPIQYFGPTEVCDQPTKTLALEQKK